MERTAGGTADSFNQTLSYVLRGETGAGEGIRTPDRLITNQVLYQLSYASAKQHKRRQLPRRKAEHTIARPPGGSMGRMWRLFRLRIGSLLSLSASLLLFCTVATGSLRAQDSGVNDGPLQPNRDVSRPIPLTNDTIMKMSKAGLDDTIIIQTIATHPGAYYTTPDDLIALKNAGVSQRVIAAMQAHSAGLTVRDTTGTAPTPLAPGIDDIGVYYKDKDGQWTPLKTERVQFKSSGWLKNAASDGLVKQDMNGHLDGKQSPLILPTGVQILIYTPPGTQAEEYDFIRFEDHSTSREFRVKTGGLFHSETGSRRDEIEFTPTRIARDMYVFTVPADIEKGEYGVLPPGSSNVPGISNAGKIFTFSIRE